MDLNEGEDLTSSEEILDMGLLKALEHGKAVSNLTYDVGKELGLEEKKCYELAIAGMLHDIGKLKLTGYMNGNEEGSLAVEGLRYARMHAKIGYEELKKQGYSEFVLESILYHHENYDGSGYPANLSGDDIPLGARILRVCDMFAALRSDKSYRKAFDMDTAIEVMIDEIKNFDVKVFLAFQKVVHN